VVDLRLGNLVLFCNLFKNKCELEAQRCHPSNTAGVGLVAVFLTLVR